MSKIKAALFATPGLLFVIASPAYCQGSATSVTFAPNPLTVPTPTTLAFVTDTCVPNSSEFFFTASFNGGSPFLGSAHNCTTGTFPIVWSTFFCGSFGPGTCTLNVYNINSDGSQGETLLFTWAFILQPPCNTTGAVTYGQGGWGGPSKNSPLTASFFSSNFPGGLIIGGASRSVKLDSTSAVQGFLPNGGTPDALPLGQTLDPASIKNTLAGQSVAATLNLALNPAIANACVQSGPFAGFTASALLAAANADLNGAAASKDTLSNLTDALDNLNGSLDNGVSTGFLSCSCPH